MRATACACRPAYVLFDAGYPSRSLLKRSRDEGGAFVCRLQTHRRFHGRPLRAHRRHPYGAECGRLTGGLKALVVRDGAQYDATNRLPLTAAEGRHVSACRAPIEEGIRVCKHQLGLTGCQARSDRAQQQQMTCG